MVIHPMMYNTVTSCNSATATTDGTDWTETRWETYIVDPVEEELLVLDIKHIWPIRDMPKPKGLPIYKPFIRRFQGNNRGRHWNRTRR